MQKYIKSNKKIAYMQIEIVNDFFEIVLLSSGHNRVIVKI